MATDFWDVVIVGAGPAGLSAALLLGRCRRRVLLSDSGTPRSWPAQRMHGYLSRDGMDLDEFRAVARAQVAVYPSVALIDVGVQSIESAGKGTFRVRCADAAEHRCRKVLLASGVYDQLPPIRDIEQFFGITAHPCPYCEGWEMKDLPIAIYGNGIRGFEMTRAMTAWSSDLLLCTNATAGLSALQRRALSNNGVEIISEKIVELIGDGGQLRAIRFADGQTRDRRALFFDTPCRPQSHLAERLGCRMTRSGSIYSGQFSASSVPGVFVAGNILKDVQLSIVAAAEGARAAFGINRALTRENFRQRAVGASSRKLPLPRNHTLGTGGSLR
jgi:thioredoxin reductase